MAHATDTTSTTTIWSRTTGTRCVLGTSWPVEDFLRRVQMPHRKRPYWFIVRGVCNGSGGVVEEYKTLRAAQEAW